MTDSAAPSFRYCVLPTRHDTAAAFGNVGVSVVGTPALIGFLETAAAQCAAPLLHPGEASVGAHIDVRHLAPGPVGREIEARAGLTRREGRRLSFAVEALSGDTVLMRGTHERVIVDLDRFLARPERRPASDQAGAAPLDFWFDYHSPWSFLAAVEIEALAARHGRMVRWRPLHLPRLIAAIDGRRPLEESAAFVRWYRQDLQDWAALRGVTIRYHPAYPLRPARALRATLYAQSRGAACAFALAVFKAYWTDARDISDLAVLADLGAKAGLDGAAVGAAAEDPAFKAALEGNTEEAMARGVFGVPTVDTGDKLFFGNDRLTLLDAFLRGSGRGGTMATAGSVQQAED